jgi:hypothetical protein
MGSMHGALVSFSYFRTYSMIEEGILHAAALARSIVSVGPGPKVLIQAFATSISPVTSNFDLRICRYLVAVTIVDRVGVCAESLRVA